MIYKRIFRKNGRERGVALIFALGMLGMMVVLALTFASLSFSDQKASRASTEQLAAKMLAKSAVERSLAVLSGGNSGNITVTELVSGGDANNPTHYDFLWRLITRNADVPGAGAMYTYLYNKIIGNTGTKPYWQYVTDPDDRIIGRFAYAAFKVNGLLDPVASTSTTDEATPQNRPGLTPNEIDLSALSGVPAVSSDTEHTLSTTNISNLSTYNTAHPNDVCNFPSNLLRRLFGSDNVFLFSPDYRNLRDKITSSWFAVPRPVPTPEVYSYVNGGVTTLQHRFNLNRTPAEWSDLTVDQLCALPDAAYHPASPITDSSNNPNVQTAIPWFYADGADTNAYQKKQIAANFLAYFSPRPNSWTEIDRRKYWDSQTTPTYTANMRTPYLNEIVLDFRYSVSAMDEYYLDGASEKLISGGLPPAGTYEIIKRVELQISARAYAELVDLYGSQSEIGTMTVSLPSPVAETSAKFSYTDPAAPSTPITYTPASAASGITIPDLTVDSSLSSSPYYPCLSGGTASPVVLTVDIKGTMTVSDDGSGNLSTQKNYLAEYSEAISFLTMKSLNVTFKGNETPYDFAYVHTGSGTGGETSLPGKGSDSLFATPMTALGDVRHYFVGFRVRDPAANLNYAHHLSPTSTTSEWGWPDGGFFEETSDSETGENNGKAVANLGQINNYRVPASTNFSGSLAEQVDLEDHPSGNTGYGGIVSTSYIRGHSSINDTLPIQSPWEIGGIHRYEAFQTLNIKKYNTGATVIGAYSDGDANIFDYVKIVPDSNLSTPAVIDPPAGDSYTRNSIYGLVNINDVTADGAASPPTMSDGNLAAAKALFHNITRGSAFTGNPNEAITSGSSNIDAEQIVLALAAQNNALQSAASPSKFSTRASILNPNYSALYNLLVAPGTSTDHDFQLEELAGKFILLTSAESAADKPGDSLIVIAVGQSIKQGSAGVPDKDWLKDGTFTIPNFSSYADSMTSPGKENYQNALIEAGFGYMAAATATNKRFVRFATLPNATQHGMNPSNTALTATNRGLHYYPGYDELLATQKIVAWLRKDKNGNWKVERYEYVD